VDVRRFDDGDIGRLSSADTRSASLKNLPRRLTRVRESVLL
jgi:hypothetical protein